MTESPDRPPFGAVHVGSFVRPTRLIVAARAHKAEALDDADFRAIQDASVREIVAFQEGLGLKSITDGEFRRRSWSAGFIDAVQGFGLRAEGAVGFKSKSGEEGLAASPFAEAPIRRRRPIVTDDYHFLKPLVRRGLPKVTMASPPVMHFFLGPRSVDDQVYPDIEAYFADLVAIYRQEIADLAAAGCTYLQLDETALPCNCDESVRATVRARGEDPDALTLRYVRLINQAIAERPKGMTVALHMCRGNLKGAWMAAGGYGPIAEQVFGGLEVDALLMEYDTPRAGDFEPLRHLPADKTAILGLVSTKTPELESKDELKRRIDEAARFVPLERLGLSPQCGFSSGSGGGQVVTQDDTRRKLALIVEVADEVWG